MLMKVLVLSGIGFVFSAAAQTPAFEVASIKPSPAMGGIAAQIMAGKIHVGMRVDGDRVDIGNWTLRDLIQAAYKVKLYQVSGPGWMSEQRFDITAKIPEGAARDQVPALLQALLAERFKLSVRRETRELPAFALVVEKGGSKLITSTEAEPDVPAGPEATKNGFALDTANGRMSVSTDNKGGAVVSGGRAGRMRMSMGPDRTMTMEAAKMTLPALADQLAAFLDRPVFDLTELKGSYQVKLELSMEDLMQAAKAQGIQLMPMPGQAGRGAVTMPDAASDPSGGSIFQSVERLGLKLDSRKIPVDLVVVDHLEKMPTEN